MYGAIFGDVIGSYYEVHCTKDYDFDFHKDSCFTDDTVLTASVCDAILYNSVETGFIGKRSRAKEYAARYKQYYTRYPNVGFGLMFQKWAKLDHFQIQHSYANGGAMRVVPLGYAYSTIDEVEKQAVLSCYYTHNHPEAITGAKSVASAVYLAYNNVSKESIKRYLEKNFHYNLSINLCDIRDNYKFDSRSSYSVPPAILAFLESTNYEDAIRKAISLGGDADTMAAIAGGIAEAYYKNIPEHIKSFCLKRIDSSLKQTVNAFYIKFCPDMNK